MAFLVVRACGGGGGGDALTVVPVTGMYCVRSEESATLDGNDGNDDDAL